MLVPGGACCFLCWKMQAKRKRKPYFRSAV